jgi:hypothetical protein
MNKTFNNTETWGQCYKNFYHGNLPPFHYNTVILCYKAIYISLEITLEWQEITAVF